MLAAIRPGDWELPLLVHVGGAMVLVGSLVAVLVIALAARRGGAGTAGLARLAYRVLLLGVLPAWIVMRVGAQWVEGKEDWDDPGWIGIGYSTSEGGLLLIVAAIFLARRAMRRTGGVPAGGTKAVVVLCSLLLVAYTVTIWAMTTKPG